MSRKIIDRSSDSTPALSVNAVSAPSLNSNGIMSKRTEKAFQTTGKTLLQLPNPHAVAERAASFFSGIPSSSAQLAVALILVLLAYNMIAGSVVGTHTHFLTTNDDGLNYDDRAIGYTH